MTRNIFKVCEEANADVRSGPHAWIQWKGTDVCADVRCSCGKDSHVDASFAYTIKCGHCGRLWAVCPEVRLIEITEAELVGRCKPVVSDAHDDDDAEGA